MAVRIDPPGAGGVCPGLNIFRERAGKVQSRRFKMFGPCSSRVLNKARRRLTKGEFVANKSDQHRWAKENGDNLAKILAWLRAQIRQPSGDWGRGGRFSSPSAPAVTDRCRGDPRVPSREARLPGEMPTDV